MSPPRWRKIALRDSDRRLAHRFQRLRRMKPHESGCPLDLAHGTAEGLRLGETYLRPVGRGSQHDRRLVHVQAKLGSRLRRFQRQGPREARAAADHDPRGIFPCFDESLPVYLAPGEQRVRQDRHHRVGMPICHAVDESEGRDGGARATRIRDDHRQLRSNSVMMAAGRQFSRKPKQATIFWLAKAPAAIMLQRPFLEAKTPASATQFRFPLRPAAAEVRVPGFRFAMHHRIPGDPLHPARQQSKLSFLLQSTRRLSARS